MPPAETPKTLAAEPGGSVHWSLDVAFPVYAIAFTGDRTVVLAGGGGSSRTGVKNRLSMWTVDTKKRQIDLDAELELSKSEDAPMSVAVLAEKKKLVAGINSGAERLKEGVNENLRLFSYTSNSITLDSVKQTMLSTDEDHYQKVTAFNRSSPTLLAIGSTNSQLSVLAFPELNDLYPSIDYDGEEMFDADFDDSGEMFVGTSSKRLCVWPTKAPSRGQALQSIQVIERPVLKKELACTFRAAKFGRKSTSTNIYTVVNASPAVRTKKAAAGEKKSFVSLWDTKTWKLVKTRTVSQKPVTAFDISENGLLLAYGSSDLSVGVLDALTLRSLMTILQAHEFPVTALRFSPASDLVISGSADNTIRVITIGKGSRGGSSVLWKMLLSLIVLLMAIYLQRLYGDDLLRISRAHSIL